MAASSRLASIVVVLMRAARSESGQQDEDQRHALSAALLIIIDWLVFGQHPIVQDSANEDIVMLASKEQNMAARLDPPEARTDMLTGTADARNIDEIPGHCLELIDVARGLNVAPSSDRVFDDRI